MAPARGSVPRGRALAWSDVLLAVSSCPGARERLGYRGSLDRLERVELARALTRVEDWAEVERPRWDRAGLRALRRSVE